VFVVVYGKLLTLLYIEDLLEKVKRAFCKQFASQLDSATGQLDFKERFEEIRTQVEFGAMKKKVSKKKPSAMRSFHQTSKGKKAGVEKEEEPEDDGVEDAEDAFEKLKAAQAKKKGQKMGGFKSKSPKNGKPKSPGGKERKSPKKATDWHTGPKKITQEAMDALDMSKPGDGDGDGDDDSNPALQAMRNQFIPDSDDDEEDDMWEDDEDDDDDEKKKNDSSWLGSKIGGFFGALTGNQTLDAENIQPSIVAIKENLIGKNVASEVAEDICESIASALIGQKTDSFQGIQTKVTAALEDALTRVLTPKKSTDILRAVQQKKGSGKPFSIVFVGVNGVGKSTSLSKVCYYLKNMKCKMLIAACDTFRSGAVEQLRTHAKCLDVDLFERGYAKDPAAVAGAAIAHGEEEGYDCVLVDTAGRMQNNEPLMRALAKLVTQNEPDMVLFVGEALVGNDGVDQLQLFNQALIDYSPSSIPHTIDGMVLTKFDTVDDKVGAAVSMVYKTGQPVMFVGTGQKYNHLKKLNVRSVIKQLFS